MEVRLAQNPREARKEKAVRISKLCAIHKMCNMLESAPATG